MKPTLADKFTRLGVTLVLIAAAIVAWRMISAPPQITYVITNQHSKGD